MLYRLYEYLLMRQITDLPGQVCFMISGKDMADAPGKLYEVTSWCAEINRFAARHHPPGARPAIAGLTFHIATDNPAGMDRYLPQVRKIGSVARLVLHAGDRGEISGTGMDVVVAVGKSGREEIAQCIRRMAEDHIRPEDVSEAMLESYLTFQYTPDVVIKSGGDHLTDFLIWQSVYSELFFSDVNWKFFRKVDLLRVLRDYPSRVRRFGK